MKQPFCAPSEALRRVLDAAAALPKPAAETLPLDDAVGRIAAGTLSARMDQPPFDRSPFDGYALHSADTAGASRETPVTLPVTMKLYAGDAPASPLPAGCAARIMTGAPLPEGASPPVLSSPKPARYSPPPISACWPGRDTLKSPFTRR